MRLQELFNYTNTLSYKWKFKGSEEAFATFDVGGIPYMFHVYITDNPRTWEVEFSSEDKNRANSRFYGLTGSGNSAAVMSAVSQILKEFLREYSSKIDILTFGAEEPSRQSLYAKMAHRLLPDWKLTNTDGKFILIAPSTAPKLTETTEEDRALISLSSAIYAKLQPYISADIAHTNIFDIPEQQLIKLGKIGDMFDTSIEALNDVSIDIQSGEPIIDRAKDPGQSISDYEGKLLYGFYEEDTRTVVFNLELLDKHRMKTSITHELRHALDEIKSGSFPGDAKGYFTPRKKEHRKDDPYSTTQYRAQPAEINARFVEVLDILSKRIPKWKDKIPLNQVRPQVMNDLTHLLVKYEIADLFPEKTQSRDYKRLLKRAVDFIDKEIQHVSLN